MNDLYLLVFQLVVLVMSVVIHEVSHGIVALWQGDPTAKLAGRLTINPMKHLDLFGSIILPLLLVVARSPILFGWAKPVPYNPYNLRNQKWGAAMVGLAGPASNFLIAIVFGVALRFLPTASEFLFLQNLFQFFAIIVKTNVFLGVFNLVPVPPLDGSKLLFSLLPPGMSSARMFLERNGFLVLLLFLFFGFHFITPVVGVLFRLITGIGA